MVSLFAALTLEPSSLSREFSKVILALSLSDGAGFVSMASNLWTVPSELSWMTPQEIFRVFKGIADEIDFPLLCFDFLTVS